MTEPHNPPPSKHDEAGAPAQVNYAAVRDPPGTVEIVIYSVGIVLAAGIAFVGTCIPAGFVSLGLLGMVDAPGIALAFAVGLSCAGSILFFGFRNLLRRKRGE